MARLEVLVSTGRQIAPLPLKLRLERAKVLVPLARRSIVPPGATKVWPALPEPPSIAPPATFTVPAAASEPLT